MFLQLCGQSHKTVSINDNFLKEEKGEPKRLEPRSFCLPAKCLTARPLRLTGANERKHGALRPQKPLRLIRDGEVGGSGILHLTPTPYTGTTRMILH